MSEPLQIALDELIKKIAVDETVVAEATARMMPLKVAANSLCGILGKAEIYDLSGTSPNAAPSRPGLKWQSDQFFNRPLSASVVEYMEAREKAGMEKPASVDEIYAALCEGGFKFKGVTGESDNHKNALKISLAKNTAQFTKVGEKFALRKWYGMRATSKKNADDAAEDGGTETEDNPIEEAIKSSSSSPVPNGGMR